MHEISAVICFGIAEPQVDDLIEVTRGTPLQSARWIVFGRDISRLGGLVAHWQGQVEVIIVRLPSADMLAQDAALLILEAENVSTSGCIWLQSEDVPCPLPEIAWAVRLGSSEPPDSLNLLRRLATIGASKFGDSVPPVREA